MSDFSLLDAIESGIVKVPRVPVDDNSGDPDPRYLDLWETKLNDEALAALSTLTNLEELNLEATDITNDSLATLLKFQNLARLNIAGTQLDDDGVRDRNFRGLDNRLNSREHCGAEADCVLR